MRGRHVRESCPPDAEGFVLAGGRGTRMGRDKALITINGQTLIERALGILRGVVDVPRIAGARPDLERYAPVVADLRKDCGPLGGIEAALSASAQPLNVFLAVDLPLLPSHFLIWLVQRARTTGAMATIPVIGAFPQPLVAVYRREILPRLSMALERGEYRTIDAVCDAARESASNAQSVDLIRVEMAAASGQFHCGETGTPVSGWFRNLNAPGDLDAIAPSRVTPGMGVSVKLSRVI